jgi:hypothetical protein
MTDVRPPITEPFLLPENPPRYGPVSKRLLLRLVAILLSVQIIGAWLAFVVATDRHRAAGLSLVFPGGGFLFAGLPGLFFVNRCVAGDRRDRVVGSKRAFCYSVGVAR